MAAAARAAARCERPPSGAVRPRPGPRRWRPASRSTGRTGRAGRRRAARCRDRGRAPSRPRCRSARASRATECSGSRRGARAAPRAASASAAEVTAQTPIAASSTTALAPAKGRARKAMQETAVTPSIQGPMRARRRAHPVEPEAGRRTSMSANTSWSATRIQGTQCCGDPGLRGELRQVHDVQRPRRHEEELRDPDPGGQGRRRLLESHWLHLC